MPFSKSTTPESSRAAQELIAKQLVDGRRALESSKEPRSRVSARAFEDAEAFFSANQMGRGIRPASVDPESIKELITVGALRREGHARGTTYTLLKRPLELQIDGRIKPKARRLLPRPRAASSMPREAGVVTLDAGDVAYVRANVREYLAFATSTESRKHEERRQSENILDLMHGRSKEILRQSREMGGPRMTPLDAMRQAQVEIALDFEQLLKVKWLPIMFELFGMEQTADTDMRTMRG